MSKRILLTIAIAVMMIAVPAMAAPTTTNVTWSGFGINVGINAVAGDDATSVFSTMANSGAGNFNFTNYSDNPYGYNVDTTDVFVNASVAGGGTMEFTNTRTDSLTSMYGNAGQVSYSWVNSSDVGEMATGTWTNYAALQDPTYGKPKTTNGHNFEASGASFEIVNSITASDGDGAQLWTQGSGSTMIDVMNSGSMGGAFSFGEGGGCYTNADVEATGSGFFNVNAWLDFVLDVGSILPEFQLEDD